MIEHETKDTAQIAVSVISIAATPGAGRLIALATVLIDIDGVQLTVRGVRLVRHWSEQVFVELPTVRDHAGRLEPLIDLPPEIARAIDLAVRREVIETVAERIAANVTGDRDKAMPSITKPGS